MIIACQICGKEHDVDILNNFEKIKLSDQEYTVKVTSYECSNKKWATTDVLPLDGYTAQETYKKYLKDFGEYLQRVGENNEKKN